MNLIEEALRRRSEFSQVRSDAEADRLLDRQPAASVHVVNATRAASDSELMCGNVHTEAFIRAMEVRTALVKGGCAEGGPIDPLIAGARKEPAGVDGVETLYVCGAVSAGWSEDTET